MEEFLALKNAYSLAEGYGLKLIFIIFQHFFKASFSLKGWPANARVVFQCQNLELSLVQEKINFDGVCKNTTLKNTFEIFGLSTFPYIAAVFLFTVLK